MGNLFTRRAIAFLLAVALAILAAFAVLNYVNAVRADVAEEADLVVGYVATQRIDPGTLADTAIQLDAIEERQIPRELLATDAVTDLTQITGRVVQEVILPGDQILNARFSAPGQGADVLTIPPDHQAMSFQVGIDPGVAGFLREGDHVSLIVNINAEGPDDEPADEDTDEESDEGTGTVTNQVSEQQRAQYLLQDVEILAIGRRVQPTEENPAGGTSQDTGGVLLTVAVLPDEAEQLAYAVQNGAVWLTLLPEDEREPVTTPGRTIENLFDDN